MPQSGMPFKNPHPLYSMWYGMKQRCTYKKHKAWADYGGRGITVCARWLEPNGDGFRNFVADMGERPAGFQIDRTNNDGHYEPGNCQWVSRKDQQKNQSVTRKVVIDGQEYIAAVLSDVTGLKTDTIIERAKKGLSLLEVTDPKPRRSLDGLAVGGIANGLRQQSKTHCPQGHEYTESNTYVSAVGHRTCRTCRALRESVRRSRIASP